MGVRVGIVGLGVMGADHAGTLATAVRRAEIEAVHDADNARAEVVAGEVGARRVLDDPFALIADRSVDAVLIAAPDRTHRPLTLACLAAGKPVLCEKPLAPSAAECLEVVRAEVALGRRLVQVGYNRRFDPPYVEVRRRIAAGELGRALLLHNLHRNVSVLPWFDDSMSVTNAAVHDFDISRWLLGAEFASIRVFRARLDGDARGAPLFFVLETEAGQVVSIEVFVSARYGYDVRAELVCDAGTVAVRPPALIDVLHGLRRAADYPPDWRGRFADAYRLQAQAWIDSIGRGGHAGASAWDGYATTRIAEVALVALAEGRTQPVRLPDRPALDSD